MDVIMLDGDAYHVRVRYETLNRTFRIPEGPNAGKLLSHVIDIDPEGTYYDYSFQVEEDPRHPEDYDNFYWAISAPDARHVIMLPFGQEMVQVDCLITGAPDVYAGRSAGRQRWKRLNVSVQARRPSRLPE